MCVVGPLHRSDPLTSTGHPGHCDGFAEQDFHALWADTPAKNPGAGALVQSQLWYRDPLNTSHQATNLSDAIEFTVGL
jgi:hypothetical protein